MKIGILYDDAGSKNLDLRRPDLGNPGVGGTQFCFLMLIYYYKIYYQEHQIMAYNTAQNGNIYWEDVNVQWIENIDNFVKKCCTDKVDVVLFNVTRIKQFYNDIINAKLLSIVWVHNYLNYELLHLLKENKYVKRVVFVGKEQYDRYVDDDLIKKSVCIFNMFNAKCLEYMRGTILENSVTYTGALMKGKGFHALAREWKYVIKEVPDAKLYVIGSGRLYNRNAVLGNYNIASPEYEKEFMKYITDSNGRILPSVKFLGILGREKVSIYQKTKVGIVNPTARTEICPLSAIEMEACGIPVISKNKNGMPDVISDGCTGLLSNTRYGFRKNLVMLLKDNNLNKELSEGAKKFVLDKFSPEYITFQWNKQFLEVINSKEVKYNLPKENWFNNYKFLRVMNRKIRKIPIFSWLPSVAAIECSFVHLLGKIKRR